MWLFWCLLSWWWFVCFVFFVVCGNFWCLGVWVKMGCVWLRVWVLRLVFRIWLFCVSCVMIGDWLWLCLFNSVAWIFISFGYICFVYLLGGLWLLVMMQGLLGCWLLLLVCLFCLIVWLWLLVFFSLLLGCYCLCLCCLILLVIV